MKYSFVLTGGGTGGHVFPALAVADILKTRGHRILYVGTRDGIESRLVSEAGYDMEYVRIGALNRVGRAQQVRTALQLPQSILTARAILRRCDADAVFSLGGFVAGPVMLAAIWGRIPLTIMEPNAIPGFANRRVARRVYRALVGFETTRAFFPAHRADVTGVPIRAAFFDVNPKQAGPFTVLMTGGSRGARTLNRAARESFPFFRRAAAAVRFFVQTGTADYEAVASDFRAAGLDGDVVPFIRNMPEAFAAADLVVARSGAGSVNEIAAAGMPSILVPFPFAADNHQEKNAAQLANAGGAKMVRDNELTGERLFDEIESLRTNDAERSRMRKAVRPFARPEAAERAADILEQSAKEKKFK